MCCYGGKAHTFSIECLWLNVQTKSHLFAYFCIPDICIARPVESDLKHTWSLTCPAVGILCRQSALKRSFGQLVLVFGSMVQPCGRRWCLATHWVMLGIRACMGLRVRHLQLNSSVATPCFCSFSVSNLLCMWDKLLCPRLHLLLPRCNS